MLSFKRELSSVYINTKDIKFYLHPLLYQDRYTQLLQWALPLPLKWWNNTWKRMMQHGRPHERTTPFVLAHSKLKENPTIVGFRWLSSKKNNYENTINILNRTHWTLRDKGKISQNYNSCSLLMSNKTHTSNATPVLYLHSCHCTHYKLQTQQL